MAGLTRVAVALGSNLGDRGQHLAWAMFSLGTVIEDLRASAMRESDAVEVPDEQPPYLNAVVVGFTALPPRPLLDALLTLERQRGRLRPSRNAPRILDLDLVLYGDQVIEEPGLTVPHPRFRHRAFVLEPLAELAPEWLDPVTGVTVGEMWERWTEGGQNPEP